MATIKDIISVCDSIPKLNTFVNFIETGTGEGDSVDYCRKNGCQYIWSIEIHPELYNKAYQRFKNYDNCIIVNSDSVSALEKILFQLDGDTLFFLDAHFPGADFHYNEYNTTEKGNIRIPLENELKAICLNRDLSKHKDVFVIDDLRIYEDGPYEMGNWEQRKQLGSDKGLDFIYKYLGKTHNIKKYYEYTGFVIAIPKEQKC